MHRISDTSNDRGFTLVEILVAIVLVGVLSAVVVVGVGGLTSSGSTAACEASLDAARAAATVHLTTTGAQPATFTAMVSSGAITLPSGVTADAAGTRLVGDGWSLAMSGAPPTFACETPAVTAPAPALTGYAAAVMADSPIAYWQLDETSGTAAADIGSSGTTGTRAVAATGVPSPLGTGAATTFSSPTSAGITATVGAGTPLDRGSPISIEAWINPSQVGQHGGIVEKSVGTTVNTQYLFFVESGGLVFRITTTDGAWQQLFTNYAPAVGQWTHVVATSDGNWLRVYANGAEVGSLARGGTVVTGAGTIHIGQLGTGASNYAFKGSIDEVAVYSTALSPTRIAAHYAAR